MAGENVTRSQGALQTRHPEGQQPAWHILSVLNYKVGSARKTSRVAGHSIFWVTLPKCFRGPLREKRDAKCQWLSSFQSLNGRA